jgi:hypothetical protein
MVDSNRCQARTGQGLKLITLSRVRLITVLSTWRSCTHGKAYHLISSLRRSISLSANPQNKEKYRTYKDARAIHDLRRAKGLACKAPFKPKWIKAFIEGIPSDTIADDLVYDFLEKHSVIKAHIGSPNIGLKLQAVDSEIMALVLDNLRLENIPALPVHDSIIVIRKHKQKARAVMAQSFEQITGFPAQIKAT